MKWSTNWNFGNGQLTPVLVVDTHPPQEDLRLCAWPWPQWLLNFWLCDWTHTGQPVSTSCFLALSRPSSQTVRAEGLHSECGLSLHASEGPHWRRFPSNRFPSSSTSAQMTVSCLVRCLFNFYISMTWWRRVLWANRAYSKDKFYVDILIAEHLRAHRPCSLHLRCLLQQWKPNQDISSSLPQELSCI